VRRKNIRENIGLEGCTWRESKYDRWTNNPIDYKLKELETKPTVGYYMKIHYMEI